MRGYAVYLGGSQTGDRPAYPGSSSRSATLRRTPKYRRQRCRQGSDLAFVEIGGRRHCLGANDSPDSHVRCHRLIAEG